MRTYRSRYEVVMSSDRFRELDGHFEPRTHCYHFPPKLIEELARELGYKLPDYDREVKVTDVLVEVIPLESCPADRALLATQGVLDDPKKGVILKGVLPAP